VHWRAAENKVVEFGIPKFLERVEHLQGSQETSASWS
jgi:hypothetical protein